MSTNNTQPGHSLSESLIANNENESNIHQILSQEIENISQSSSIPFNPTDMIPNLQQYDNVLGRQHARRGHQYQQQFQQRQEPQQRQEEEQQRQLRQEQRQQLRQRECQRRERDEEYFNEMWNKDPLEEPMEEGYNEALLDAYTYERMNPQERQETWEQQHLNDLQGIPLQSYYGAPLDDLQRFAMQQEQQLMYDEYEQTMRIYEMEYWNRLSQYKRNNEDLIHLEQWKDIAFRLQQLN